MPRQSADGEESIASRTRARISGVASPPRARRSPKYQELLHHLKKVHHFQKKKQRIA